jgi:hypothetical protein
VTGQALLAALQSLEQVLQEEAKASMGDALAARKDAAITSLQALMAQGLELEAGDADAVGARLQALLAANRYSLKWSGLRAQLAQLGLPKAPVQPPTRPRLDLVH